MMNFIDKSKKTVKQLAGKLQILEGIGNLSSDRHLRIEEKKKQGEATVTHTVEDVKSDPWS